MRAVSYIQLVPPGLRHLLPLSVIEDDKIRIQIECLNEELCERRAEIAELRRLLPAEQFVLTKGERAILVVLKGRSLKCLSLAKAIGVAKRQLFREGWLPRLRRRNIVAHDPHVGGYYLPGDPPRPASVPNLTPQSA